MKAHIAVDADSGLVHTVTTTAANEADVEQIADLLHGKEKHVWADSGDCWRWMRQCVRERHETSDEPRKRLETRGCVGIAVAYASR